jgi:predicted nucleic-acid-binding protein
LGRQKVKLSADTNVLVRAVTPNDEKQGRAASSLLKSAEVTAVSLPCLCEFVWVLARVYKFEHAEISAQSMSCSM